MPRYLQVQASTSAFERKPDWIKVRLPTGENYERIKGLLKKHNLHTVCEEAFCPNIAECWGGGTATFMIMGDTCTRACRFCMVKSGNPKGWLDPLEPLKVARVVAELRLTYVVITSVDRDDLSDGGASHFARTIAAIKAMDPNVIVEVLIPDFEGDITALRKVVEAKPEVIAHNIETVYRLTPQVRDRRASYYQSLQVLKNVKKLNPAIYTKSSIILGFGETEEEVIKTMLDLRDAHCDMLTLGQYLRPSKGHYPVMEYVRPERFEYYKRLAEEMGFIYVASGPLVRSSYKAGELFLENVIRRSKRIFP